MKHWDPESYAAHARFVSLGAPVVDLLAPQPGERILDLGCGDGALTERLRNAGCLVVGVDSSPEQVWAALERGLDARIVDALELPFDEEFDAVFSNAVLHWIRDADAAIDGVWKALRPGEVRGECGGAGCVASVRECFAKLGAAASRRRADPCTPTEAIRAPPRGRAFRSIHPRFRAPPSPAPRRRGHRLRSSPSRSNAGAGARAAAFCRPRCGAAGPGASRPGRTWSADYAACGRRPGGSRAAGGPDRI